MKTSKKCTVQEQDILKAIFLDELRELLMPSNKKGKSARNYLHRVSIQQGVRNFNVHALITDIAFAGVASIERNGEGIENVSAWMRGVGKRLITKQVRGEIRDRNLHTKQRSSISGASNDLWKNLLEQEQLEQVFSLIAELSASEQEILQLRFTSELNYKEIQSHYQQKTGETVSEAALRQRECRAIKKLRTKYEKR